MEAMALEITGDSGGPAGQANTQSPQTSAAAGAGSPAAAPASSVQPGTADNLLKGTVGGGAGIPLGSTNLPIVSLDTSTQTATPTTSETTAKPQHHPNTVLLVMVAVLVLVAVLTMWLTRQSAKNTTH